MSEAVGSGEESSIGLVTTHETRHDSEMIRITAPEFSLRLESYGLNHYKFYWPTDVSKDEVVDIIYGAGRSIKASSYGCAHDNGMSWMTRDGTTVEDTESSVFHMSMLMSLLRNCGVMDLSFSELATATPGYKAIVRWTQAFDDGDYSRNQLCIGGNYPDLKLTDNWVGELIRATADSGLVLCANAVTTTFQNSFESEGALLSLKTMQFPLE